MSTYIVNDRRIRAALLNSGGPLKLPSGTRFVMNSDGYVTNMIVQEDNVAHFGKYPQYVRQAHANGDPTFEMSDNAWQSMSTEERRIRINDSSKITHDKTRYSTLLRIPRRRLLLMQKNWSICRI